MSSWKIVYLLGGVLWLMFTLRDLAQRLVTGSITLPSVTQVSAATRVYTIVHLFWTYLCGAVLWPGSVVLYVAAKIITQGDDEE